MAYSDKGALTLSELQVLQSAANGMDIATTAKTLYKAVPTVKAQRAMILRKLLANNIVHAVAIAMRKGLIE